MTCTFHRGGSGVIIDGALDVGSRSEWDLLNAAAENGVCGNSKPIYTGFEDDRGLVRHVQATC